ncbi:MAG: patatin-like phospholipase family protein [Beijerinckiaceae bacterium]
MIRMGRYTRSSVFLPQDQREMTCTRIGLALGSGSARGWSHIGVIDALADAGIEPDIVSGTSIGSMIGAAYVAGQLPALRQWALAATWREIVGLMDVRLSSGGLIEGKQIVAFLQALGISGPIEGYAKKFAAVATDLVTGREIWLQSGPIHEVVRASIALPGIISPARIGDQWLVDGGLSNPVPVSVCRALGADVIIAVNLNGDLVGRRFASEPEPSAVGVPAPVASDSLDRMLQHLPEPLREQAMQMIPRLLGRGSATPGYFDVIANSINIMQDQITRTRLAGEPPHVMLVPRLRDIGLLDFNRASEAIAEGRASVEQALPSLRRYL